MQTLRTLFQTALAATLLTLPGCLGGYVVLRQSPKTQTPQVTAPTFDVPTVSTHVLTFVNNCTQTVWPAALANPGYPVPDQTDWMLAPQSSQTIKLPGAWAGRFWGRTGCATNSEGTFTCATGDCGAQWCNGGGATPVSLIEANFNPSGGNDYYDISLVDAFNLPLEIGPTPTPQTAAAAQGCVSPTCSTDINQICPTELQQKDAHGNVVACFSGCSMLHTDALCCTGAYNLATTCPPTSLSDLFKKACPQAYSYAYDDSSSTYTCSATQYTITFCPTAATSPTAITPGTDTASSLSATN